jgi:N-methylhydantoinase B
LDNDGIDEERRRVRVAITIKGDTATVDFTGTAEQSKGPINVGLAMARCFAFMGLKAALDPDGPINSGSFRPIQVVAPSGSMLNARPPAAMGGMGELGQASIYTMIALADLTPASVSAEDGAGANHQNLSGTDARNDVSKPFN